MRDSKNTFLLLLLIFLAVSTAYLYYAKTRSGNEIAVPINVEENDQEENEDWLAATGTDYSFRYPANSGTDYLVFVDWPPQVQIEDKSFSCTEAGEEVARSGKTETVIVNDKEYCRTIVSEGAAGSIYLQYAYATAQDNQTLIFTFTTRSPQCANYDEPKMSDCKREQAQFDPDKLIDGVVDTF